MNIIQLTNRIALITVALLFYWVFIFICSTVFDFKVLRENMSEAFSSSILGIIAILIGAIVLNIMFNLTAIAERKTPHDLAISARKRNMYFGGLSTAQKKKEQLVGSATALIKEQDEIINQLGDYSFSREYINQTSQSLKVLSRVEEKFPKITIIKEDEMNDKPMLLGFARHDYLSSKKKPLKADYILSTSSEEREYLYAVFDGKENDYRFSSNDGQYEIYFPVTTKKGKIVIHMSQYSRYGKLGS